MKQDLTGWISFLLSNQLCPCRELKTRTPTRQGQPLASSVRDLPIGFRRTERSTLHAAVCQFGLRIDGIKNIMTFCLFQDRLRPAESVLDLRINFRPFFHYVHRNQRCYDCVR